MKRGLIVLAIFAGLVAVPLAYALATETPVFNSGRNERNPAADFDSLGGEVWAFTKSRSGYPNRYDAYAKEGTNASFKLNTVGQAWTGGIDYPTVVYQRIYSGQSNIYLYDLSNDTRPATPEGVNTTKWEWHPTVSGDWLLYGRDDNSTPTQRVILHDSASHNERLLSYVTKATHYLQPDQVNGDYATYTRCTPVCNVVRYQITTQTKVVLPKPVTSRSRHQYAGAVTSAGVVYLVRSGPNCGERVKIVRYDNPTVAGYGTVVAELPTGVDIATMYARENGTVEVFYDRVNCSTGRFDIYKIPGA